MALVLISYVVVRLCVQETRLSSSVSLSQSSAPRLGFLEEILGRFLSRLRSSCAPTRFRSDTFVGLGRGSLSRG